MKKKGKLKKKSEIERHWPSLSRVTSSIPELERRMRPGDYSAKGFLGRTESLESVIAHDDQVLKDLGFSHEQIADALENVLRPALSQRDELLKVDPEEFYKRELSIRDENLCFSLDNLPGLDVGYLVRGMLQVFITQYRGFQNCPWGCEHDGGNGSIDFLILNRESGESLAGPGLIGHLIGKHHFFEGLESPYRVEPARIVQVLELVSEGVALPASGDLLAAAEAKPN